MQLIKVNKLKKYYGDRLILNIDKLEIFEGDKIGLVGVNGAGKTTLLNIICGKEGYEEGNVFLDCSYSYVNQLDEEVNIEDSKISKELKLPNEYNSFLSGGEKVKARVAKALNNNSRIIIADEPTSNLDVQSIKYLEEKFISFNGAILLVSHDRDFLDNICNKIIEIDESKVTMFNGNYTSYLKQKEERVNRQSFEYNQYIKEKRRIEEAVISKIALRDGIKKTPKRFGNSEARLHKMGNQSAKKNMDNSIKAIKTRIEKLEEKEKPKENAVIKIDIAEGNEFYSNYPIEIKDINISFNNKIILKNASFKLKKNTRVALIGENGCGKTTLLKAIINNNEGIKIANRVKIGYFQQDLMILNEDKTILDNILESSSENETFIRIILSRFLFRENDVYKRVSILSGGEKVRVALCKIILSDNNLLILDEPTNYLDIQSMEALEEALKNSNKTMIIVSHDRRFIANVCNEILCFEDNTLKYYPYAYNEWIKRIKDPQITKKEREINEKKMVLQNRLSEMISLISIEGNATKKLEYEKQYDEILREIRLL